MKNFYSRLSARFCSGKINVVGRMFRKENVLKKNVMQSMIAMAFVFLCAGAWAQSKVTVESEISKSGSLVLEVWGADNASVSATPVERTSPNGKQLYCAYDIDITKDGREWQPEPGEPAIVSMGTPDFADGQFLDVYHEGANGLEFVATVASKDGKIIFPARSFSVYIVTESGDYARLKVTFHRASEPREITIYVKKADIAQGYFNDIVFNPGVGTIPSGVQFRGWTTNESYDADDVSSAMTFDDVRTTITNRLNSGITDGTELDFYAMLYKSYTVTYLVENDVVSQTDELLYRADVDVPPSLDYNVNSPHTPGDNSHFFVGWKVHSPADGEHISGHTDDEHNYENLTDITINGDVNFKVNIVEGHWLIYHENGKGATYKAADFVYADSITKAPTLRMLRNGYTFDGWYEGEPAVEYGDPTGAAFTFGQSLTETQHVYAKWNVNDSANYVVIVWKQNVDCETCYDFDTVINLRGKTNTVIDTVQPIGTGNARYASINGTPIKYTGFYLKEFDSGRTVAPEGNSIVNVYYDRIEYTVKFIYYRKINKGANKNKYQYATNKLTLSENSSATSDDYLCAKWTGAFSNHPVSSYPSRDTVMGTYTYTYYPITARYGQSIVDKWPRYDYFDNFDSKRFSSWVLMIGAEARNDAVSGGGSVKGLISIMDEQILGDMTSSNGNYLVAKYSTANDWTYNIWFPQIEGEDYTARTCTTVNSVEYYKEYEIEARSGSGASGQHQPSFLGFNEVSGNQRGNNNVMDYYYSRKKYSINYMDGSYYNGNNVKLNEFAPIGQIHEVSNISYGDSIRIHGTYTPNAAPHAGFVFEGWYTDKPCTQLFDFNAKMTSANITVYAKWRQIQYRVFLHPNVDPGDNSLDWGADDQALNFRRTYNDKISVPTGIRDDYEFVGWYTNPGCTNPFYESAVVLNETTVRTAYDKTTDFTDDMDKWGNIKSTSPHPEGTAGPGYNSDSYSYENGEFSVRDRFWITKRYDLYGKWRAKLPGAEGINVEYITEDGDPSTLPTDTKLYQDNVNAIAGPACSYVDDTKEFSHWVMQTYNESTDEYEDIPNSQIFPGAPFPVLRDNAKMVFTYWCNADCSDCMESTSSTPPDDAHSDNFKARYTVKLRAEFVNETPKYTFAVWYTNDGSGDTLQVDGLANGVRTLGINETTIVIPDAPTRTGYIFKGWYKNAVTSGTPSTTDNQCTPNFLYYNNDNSRYYAESAYTTEVAKIAADIYQQTDYMYAVWEPELDFSFEPICPGSQIELPTTTEANVNLSGSWAASSGSIYGTTYTANNVYNGVVTLTFTPEASTCAKEKDFGVSVEALDIPDVSSYDYIWKGGADSRATDWDAASNWYVYNNGAYSVATILPTSEKNIYIGDYTCKNNIIPTVDGSNAYAKNITIASDATLTVLSGMTLNIAGDLDNIGAFEATKGTVVFCGTQERDADQTISHDITFGNVTFNNRGGNITPAENASITMTINGDATFTKGIVKNDVIFGENSSVAENMTYNSFVEGLVTKDGSVYGFTFPTGSNNVLGKIKTMSNVSNVSVQYFNNPDGFDISEYPRWWNVADNCAGNDPRLDHVSNFEYWTIQSSGVLNATLTVSATDGSAHFNSISTTHDGNDIYGAFWTGSCWANIGGANHFVSDDPYGNISVEVVVPATRATSGKVLSLGSIDHNTVLPIELTSFNATCDGRSTLVEWTTATEKNNDYFSIERSDDAINFTEIARVAGAGNSIDPIDYAYTDYGVRGGDNYYRLVQVDYDGTRTASEIVVANCIEPEIDEPEVLAFPNPFSGELTLVLGNFGNRAATIEVYDVLGKLLYIQNADAPQNYYETVLNLDNLPKGAYTVRVSTADFVINRNVVKN